LAHNRYTSGRLMQLLLQSKVSVMPAALDNRTPRSPAVASAMGHN
jgi:hypothetical protein